MTDQTASNARCLDLPNARQDEWRSLGFDEAQAAALADSGLTVLGYVRVMER